MLKTSLCFIYPDCSSSCTQAFAWPLREQFGPNSQFFSKNVHVTLLYRVLCVFSNAYSYFKGIIAICPYFSENSQFTKQNVFTRQFVF